MSDEADRALFGKLYPSLRRFAAVVADDDMEPDDIVQDVLVSALRSTSLADLDDAGAYLRRSIVHRVISARRSKGRRRARQPLIDADARQTTTDTYPTDLTGLLPDDPIDRAILWLTAIDDRPGREVADAVNLSPAAVRKRLSRLRAHNREGLR